MRAFFLYIILLILCVSPVSGQSGMPLSAPNDLVTGTRPLVLVDTFKTDINLLIIDPIKIESINIFKDSTAIAKYGEAGRPGVIIINPKPGVKLLRLGQILNDYNIPAADKKLRVCINKNLVRDPQLILIEQSEVTDVGITTDRHWIYTEDAGTGERFINITTRTTGKSGL